MYVRIVFTYDGWEVVRPPVNASVDLFATAVQLKGWKIGVDRNVLIRS